MFSNVEFWEVRLTLSHLKPLPQWVLKDSRCTWPVAVMGLLHWAQYAAIILYRTVQYCIIYCVPYSSQIFKTRISKTHDSRVSRPRRICRRQFVNATKKLFSEKKPKSRRVVVCNRKSPHATCLCFTAMLYTYVTYVYYIAVKIYYAVHHHQEFFCISLILFSTNRFHSPCIYEHHDKLFSTSKLLNFSNRLCTTNTVHHHQNSDIIWTLPILFIVDGLYCIWCF